MDTPKKPETTPLPPEAASAEEPAKAPVQKPDPTRFGDWEMNGRCIDF